MTAATRRGAMFGAIAGLTGSAAAGTPSGAKIIRICGERVSIELRINSLLHTLVEGDSAALDYQRELRDRGVAQLERLRPSKTLEGVKVLAQAALACRGKKTCEEPVPACDGSSGSNCRTCCGRD